MLTIKTSRFGEIEVKGNHSVHFPEGLLGFPEKKDFVILDHKPGSPFSWLQSIDTPDLAFVITNPFLIKHDYLSNLSPNELKYFDGENGSNIIIFALVTIPPGQVENMTANLLGPLVINAESRIGKQVILANSGYDHHHPLISD